MSIPLQEVGKRTGVSTTDIRAGIGIGSDGDPMFTLQATAQHGVLSVVGTLEARTRGGGWPGTDGACAGHVVAQPLAIDLQQVTSRANRSQPAPLAPTLNQAGNVIAFGWQNSAAQGASVSDDITPTLDKSKVSGVVVLDDQGGSVMNVSTDIVGAFRAQSHGNNAIVLPPPSEDGTGRGTPTVVPTWPDVAMPLMARDAKGPRNFQDGGLQVSAVQTGRPRRLTPRECERLMSWPDDWTRWGVDERGRRYELKDTPRYRLCGNGVATVQFTWVCERLTQMELATP